MDADPEPLSLDDVPSCAEAQAVGCDMPDWLVALEQAFGDSASRLFASSFGGTEIFIPSDPAREGSQVERVCGPHVTRWLRDELGCGRFVVPLAIASIQARRRVLIFRALQRGLSLQDTARLAACDRRTVSRWRRRFKQLGYL